MWEFWRGKFATGRTSPGSTAEVGSPRALERRNTAVVNFKDLNLSVDDELSEDQHTDSGYHEDEDPTNKTAIIRTKSIRSGAQKSKLIIVMVGLPGRGKTFLCNKLKCYLNWLGHNTAHFNVGYYRRLQKEANEIQDASFFDAHNKHGVEARSKALMAALDDVMNFLFDEGGQVAIFDATNTTKERRQQLITTFHGRCQYIFIESICNDTQVLENNYRYKMKYSPDYQGVDTEAALDDFKARIRKYNEVYEPIDDRRLHYIKLIDMVTGRGYMDVNRISGYIPGKIVFFLMQVCKAGMTAGQSRKIWLTRHGESCFNMAGRIGGDSLLTARGEEYARMLPDVLESRLPATFSEAGIPVSVWTSTLRRTIATANYLSYPKLRWKALDEIHAGVCDGMTYAEIGQKFPEDYEARKRDKLRYRYPSGESYLDVIQRLEPVIIEMEREREFVVVVGHQAILRAIFGYFMAVPLAKIPRLDIPLHTLIELQPRADGTMEVSFLPVPVSPPKHINPKPQHQHHQQQQQQQQQQQALGSSPTGLSGLLPTFGSLPNSYFYGNNRASTGGGGGPMAAAAAAGGGGGGGGGYHRRTASGSAVQLPRFPHNTSFATVSSMASMHSSGGGSNNSSQGDLVGGVGVSGSSQNLTAHKQCQDSPFRSPFAGGSLGLSADGLEQVSGQQHGQSAQQGASSSSSLRPQAAAGAGRQDLHNSAQLTAVDSAAAADVGKGISPEEELSLTALALRDSVALTSGAGPAAIAVAAAAAAAPHDVGSSSEDIQFEVEGIREGLSSVRPVLNDARESSGDLTQQQQQQQQRSPKLAAAISSMNSLD